MVTPAPFASGPGLRMGRAAARPPVSAWRLLMPGFCLYALFTLLREFTGGGREIFGPILFLLVTAALSSGKLFPLPLTRWTLALLLAALLPVVGLLTGLTALRAENAVYFIKYLALLFVLLAAAVLRLPPIYRTPERWWGVGAMLFILLIGLVLGSGDERVAGSFANPNNYALAAFSLLFFVDHDRDKPWLLVSVYALVFALILVSGTMGAMVGYLAGVAVVLLRTRYARIVGMAMVAGLLLGAGLLVSLRIADPQTFSETRMIGPLWTKIYIAHQHMDDVLVGDDLNFWDIGQEHGGADLTSGIWRLMHWRETLRIIGEAGLPRQLLGHGLGTSMRSLGNLPHNDYLRLLFEVGAAGMIACLVAWLLPALHMEPGARAPAVMLAVYAISENNFDNFLVMSLFALFLVSARRMRPVSPARTEATP